MDQIKPLLVTPDGDGMFTVIGGNMRLRAMRDLAEEVPGYGVWCLIIDFVHHDDDNLWRASINGRESAKRFVTKDDGMMEYALLDNERSGYYDLDSLANIMPEFTIDWDYSVDFKEANSIQEYINKYAPGSQDGAFPGSTDEGMGVPESSPGGDTPSVAGTAETEQSEIEGEGKPTESVQPSSPSLLEDRVECPDCGAVFDAKKHRTNKNESSTIDSLSDLIR